MYPQLLNIFLIVSLLLWNVVEAKPLPEKMRQIMQQDKYRHASWGIFVKDADNGEILYDDHSDQLFLPASTTKIFSVAALLKTYGDDFRFKTQVYALGSIQDGVLQGNLMLVGQGDLLLGNRQDPGSDRVAFTKLDHINANEVPGVELTKQDPLYGLQMLAKEIQEKGIKQIDGDVLIDDRLFEHTEKRGMILTPIMINENLIDIAVHPTELGQAAEIMWRPHVEGYTVTSAIKTVSKGEAAKIIIDSDDSGRNILIRGNIPIDQKELVRTFSIKDPNHFARAAFIQVLRAQGITINVDSKKGTRLPPQSSYIDENPIAQWQSPPLSEYAKLILKVSHNLGADLIPLLLAVHNGKKNYDEGMLLFGKFVTEQVKVSPDAFVFVDAAGGDMNRLTPRAEIQLLEYVRQWPEKQFKKFYEALPILGVDGSLEDFTKGTAAVGKVRAKPGTGVSFNLATHHFYLTTQALTGYVEGKNGHLIEFMIVVNNGIMPEIIDIFPIFEDISQMAALLYDSPQSQ